MPDCFERPMVASAVSGTRRRDASGLWGGFGWICGYSAGASAELVQAVSADEFVKKRRSDASTWQLFCLALQHSRKACGNPSVRVR